jgi:DNA (cytosine-5)-methyltransferase 1
MKLRVLDIFSGIGGTSLGLERTGGFETAAFCEINDWCRAVLRKHWPHVHCYEDVREIDGIRLAADGIAADVICGGFPCQPFSTAARGRNNAPDLWGSMLRLVRDVRPAWVIAENVPGLGPAGVDRVCDGLEEADYTVWPFDLDTAPEGRQRERRRFVFVAHSNTQSKPRRKVYAEMAGLRSVSGRYRSDDAAPVGMDDGLPGRMDRLGALGNAFSPVVPEIIGRAILKAEGVIQ